MFKMNSFIMVLMMCQVCLCLGKGRRPSMSDIATSAQVPTTYNRPHHKDGLPYLPISLKELRLANRLSSRRSLNFARANGVFTRKLLNALDQDADSKNLVKESKKSGRKRIFSKAAITNDQSFQRARNILDLDMRDPAAEEKLEYLVKSEDLDGKKKEERFPQSFESLFERDEDEEGMKDENDSDGSEEKMKRDELKRLAEELTELDVLTFLKRRNEVSDENRPPRPG